MIQSCAPSTWQDYADRWGYRPDRPVFSFEEVAVYLSDCAVRNINLLLNVSPDRHGVIPQSQQAVLRRMGDWLAQVGDAIYGTRGGPWQPRFGEYGFTTRGNLFSGQVLPWKTNRMAR